MRKSYSNLQYGDILLMHPYKNNWKYPVSDLIAYVTHSKWTHAAIYMNFGNILEATGDLGVHINSRALAEGKYYKDYEWTALRLKDKDKIANFVNAGLKKIGCKYDYTQAGILMFFFLLSRAFGKSIRLYDNPADARKKYFCSELVVNSLEEVGYNIQENLKIDEGNVVAEDLMKLSFVDAVSEDSLKVA